MISVTILVLVETPLQHKKGEIMKNFNEKVTILVLVETPLQRPNMGQTVYTLISHNPCFSGNSFATGEKMSVFLMSNKSQSLF